MKTGHRMAVRVEVARTVARIVGRVAQWHRTRGPDVLRDPDMMAIRVGAAFCGVGPYPIQFATSGLNGAEGGPSLSANPAAGTVFFFPWKAVVFADGCRMYGLYVAWGDHRLGQSSPVAPRHRSRPNLPPLTA